MRAQLPEIERRRRQLAIIENKIRTAEATKDQAALDSARIAYDSTQARISALEGTESTEQPRRRRGQEG